MLRLCRLEYYDVCELWILEELSTVAAEFRARVLGFWDSEFESGSRRRCLFSSSSMLRCPVLVEALAVDRTALQWTEPPCGGPNRRPRSPTKCRNTRFKNFKKRWPTPPKKQGKKEKDKRDVKGNGCGLSRNFLEEPKLR